MKNTIIATLFAFISSHLPSSGGEGSESKSWREIASGSQSNIEQATRKVIQTQEEWEKWWRKHNTVEVQIDGKLLPEPPPKVDFTEETLLVATMGTRSTGGYAIRFTGIHREDEVLTATLKTTSPGPDDLVTMALTAPYAIIAIPKHEGHVEFVDESAD